MTQELVMAQNKSIIEQALVVGDLSGLDEDGRIEYYKAVCDSLGLNPLTKPFDYLKLNSKLILYARKDATEQLRKLHGVSVDGIDTTFETDLVIVAVKGHDGTGRTDSDVGVVYLGSLKGVDKANAIMKAITKAKRRFTLSICGLGFLDETEVETIKDAEPVDFTITHVEGEQEFTPIGETLKKKAKKIDHSSQDLPPVDELLPEIDLQDALEVVMPNGKTARDCSIPILRGLVKHPNATPEQIQAIAIVIEAKEKAS